MIFPALILSIVMMYKRAPYKTKLSIRKLFCEYFVDDIGTEHQRHLVVLNLRIKLRVLQINLIVLPEL